MPEALAETDGLQCLGGSFTAFLGLHAEWDESGLDVFLGRQGRNEIEALEDETDVLAADFCEATLGQLGEICSVEVDAAVCGAVESAEHLEEGGLAAACGALDDEAVAVGDGEVDAGEGVHGFLASGVGLGYTL
jgi:hypothetical protein